MNKIMKNKFISVIILAIAATIIFLVVVSIVWKASETTKIPIIPKISNNDVDAAEYEVFEAGGEVSFCFTTTEEKWNAFKIGFLKNKPVPLETDTYGDSYPIMTDGQWVKHFTKSQLIRFYKKGMEEIHAEQQDPIEEEIFE